MPGPHAVNPRRLLVALVLGSFAAVLLWVGDSHLVRRDWLPGVLSFGLGLVLTGATVRQLRRAGVGR